MFTQEDLKKDRKDVINKILLESGRGEVISFCSEVLDKRAYFTVDMHGNIKRKKYNYAVPAAVFMENDNEFADYISENLNFTEKIKIEKIGRMTNEDTEEVKKNIFKLLVKGECHFSLRHCKELLMRDSEEFFKMMFMISMMDNTAFEKPLAVYSLKKYFEKFGYSDEALYLTISYLAKMRADFRDFENEKAGEISKEELRNRVKNSIDKYENGKGVEILGYLAALLSCDYEKENIFSNILKKKIDEFENSFEERNEELSNIKKSIYEYLSKEV